MVVEEFVAFADGNTLVPAFPAGVFIAFLNILAASFTSLIFPGIEPTGGDPVPVLAGVVVMLYLDVALGWLASTNILVSLS